MSEKILIVDDEVETIRLISLVLQRQGYQVISATNGSSGFDLAVKEIPNLILLDLMMPDIDGYQVTRQLRENPATANVPIMIFSAKGQVEDRVTGYESGIDDYLTKPVHPAELVARIKSLIARSKVLTPSPNTLPTPSKGYVIGVMAPRGGMGVSTLTLNLALALFKKLIKKPLLRSLDRVMAHGRWN